MGKVKCEIGDEVLVKRKIKYAQVVDGEAILFFEDQNKDSVPMKEVILNPIYKINKRIEQLKEVEFKQPKIWNVDMEIRAYKNVLRWLGVCPECGEKMKLVLGRERNRRFMQTWEVMKELSEHPGKIFKEEKGVRITADAWGTTAMWYERYNRVPKVEKLDAFLKIKWEEEKRYED